MRRETVVECSVGGCGGPATYKVAAPWGDRRFRELKTYGFACDDHVGEVFRDAEARWLEYEPVPGEIVQEVGIFRFGPSVGDRNLERDYELEEGLRGS
jgi:hypothetical protein